MRYTINKNINVKIPDINSFPKINYDKYFNCRFLSHFKNHNDLINRLYFFNCKGNDYSDDECDIRIKNTCSSRTTQCGLTQDSIFHILSDTEKLDPQQILYTKTSPEYIVDMIDSDGIIGLSIHEYEDFPGHSLIIYKYDDDEYVVIQSYIYEYGVIYNVGTRKAIINFIKNYYMLYDVDEQKKNNINYIALWEVLTGIQEYMKAKKPPEDLIIERIMKPNTKRDNYYCTKKLEILYRQCYNRIYNLVNKRNIDQKDDDIISFEKAFLYSEKKNQHIDVTTNDMIYILDKIGEALNNLIYNSDPGVQIGKIDEKGFPDITILY